MIYTTNDCYHLIMEFDQSRKCCRSMCWRVPSTTWGMCKIQLQGCCGVYIRGGVGKPEKQKWKWKWKRNEWERIGGELRDMCVAAEPVIKC